MLDLLPHDPVRHGIDVIADNVASETVRLKERRAAAHERIEDGKAGEIVGRIEYIAKRFIAEFRKDQPTKKRPRSPCEPLMDRDDGPVVLLNLLFTQGQG